MTSFIHLRYSAEIQGNDIEFEIDDLPPGFLEILRTEPESRLARLFRGETSDHRSTHDSALAFDLLPCGFTDNEISTVLWCNKHGQTWNCPCPDEYIAQAIAIARLSYMPTAYQQINRGDYEKWVRA
jgi:hypothetical protein